MENACGMRRLAGPAAHIAFQYPFAADFAAGTTRFSKAWAEQELAPLAAERARQNFDFTVTRRAHEKLRIGYLSWDFHRHATAYLIAELFELHDRNRFEIYAYAFGPDDGSAIRARIRAACDRFIDVADSSYVATSQAIYNDGVDILVDLKGYTQGSRPQIMALRPAPIQVNWLGYPGTMGADCIDYIIAGSHYHSGRVERFYSEKVIRLADCYQINDRRREVCARTPSRDECGLPAQGMVFCCFNLSYKILPDIFERWMRIMRAVPHSVLWLLDTNRWAIENLRRAASARGWFQRLAARAGRRPNIWRAIGWRTLLWTLFRIHRIRLRAMRCGWGARS